MKLDKSFLTLFVGLAMAACSNDEEMATGGQNQLPVDGRRLICPCLWQCLKVRGLWQ